MGMEVVKLEMECNKDGFASGIKRTIELHISMEVYNKERVTNMLAIFKKELSSALKANSSNTTITLVWLDSDFRTTDDTRFTFYSDNGIFVRENRKFKEDVSYSVDDVTEKDTTAKMCNDTMSVLKKRINELILEKCVNRMSGFDTEDYLLSSV